MKYQFKNANVVNNSNRISTLAHETRKNIRKFALCCLAGMFLTVSCTKSHYEEPKEEPISANSIIAAEVKNVTSDIKGVFAQLLYYRKSNNNYWYLSGLQYLNNEGTYKNGGFEIRFPNTFPNEFLGPLYPAYTLSPNSKVTLSDIDAKTGVIYLHASTDHYGSITKNYSPLGKFELVGDNWIADYMYSDRSFTAKGISEYGLEFDCSFNKGWNIMYRRKDFSEITTKKPLNENFTWYFIQN